MSELKLRFLDENDNKYPEWDEVKLSDHVEVIFGYPLDSKLFHEVAAARPNSFPLIRIRDILSSSLSLVTDETKVDPKYIVSRGEILIGMDGDFQSAEWNNRPAYVNQRIALLRGERIRLAYVKQLLPRMMKEINRVKHATTVKHLSTSDVKDALIPLPSIPEQQKIADFFSLLDERIGLQEAKIALLEQQKQGYMQKLFSQELRFRADDGSEYPEWKEKSLGDLETDNAISLGRGKVISKEDLKKTPGNYPVYSSSAQGEGKFGQYGEYLFDEEMISWSIDGGGKFFYRKPHKFSITNVSGFLKVLKKDEIDMRYLYQALTVLHSQNNFDYVSKAHPSVIKKLYTVRLPILEEQRKIANFLFLFEEKLKQEKQKIQLFNLEKRYFLQAVFGM